MLKTKAEQLADLLAAASGSEKVPTSAIRQLRGDRSQVEVAMKAGSSQAMLSDLEGGKKPLTSSVSTRLGPARWV